MELIPVESSNIAAIGFDSETLCVRFRDGMEYDYANVSGEEHAELMASRSKGRWLHDWAAKRFAAGRHSYVKRVPELPENRVIETIPA